MFASIAARLRSLVLLGAVVGAFALMLTASAGASSAVESASSPETMGTTVTIIDPNERCLIDPNDRSLVHSNERSIIDPNERSHSVTKGLNVYRWVPPVCELPPWCSIG